MYVVFICSHTKCLKPCELLENKVSTVDKALYNVPIARKYIRTA